MISIPGVRTRAVKVLPVTLFTGVHRTSITIPGVRIWAVKVLPVTLFTGVHRTRGTSVVRRGGGVHTKSNNKAVTIVT